MRAGTAVLGSKFNVHHRVASSILDKRPTATCLARWADGALAHPIHDKVLSSEASPLTRLPMGIIPRRPKKIDPVIVLALGQGLCVHIASIDEMPLWQEIVLLKRFVNRWK